MSLYICPFSDFSYFLGWWLLDGSLSCFDDSFSRHPLFSKSWSYNPFRHLSVSRGGEHTIVFPFRKSCLFLLLFCSVLRSLGKPPTRTHRDLSTFPHAFLSSSLYKFFSLFRRKEEKENDLLKKERTTTGVCIDVVENVDKYLVIASNALVWTNCSFSSHVDKPTFYCEYLM